MNAQPPTVGDSAEVSRRWRVVLGLLLVALVPALLSAWLHPHRPSWERAGDVTLAVVKGWPAVLWVDARSAATYDRDHVPGALNLSPGSWDSQVEAVVSAWDPDKRVVVYCDGHGCQASREVAQRLRAELGFNEIYVLTGGWDAWTEARK